MYENGQLSAININDVLPNRFQPRINFNDSKLYELSESIRKYGVIQPIVVRPIGDKFEIIAGERRFKASKLADKTTIPAIIVDLSDKASEEIALLENVQRQNLSPIEEAASYKRILDMGYINTEELGKKIGKSPSAILKKIRLLSLDDEVQEYLLKNKISERHARSLLRLKDKEEQVSMLHRIVNERLTVKKADREISSIIDGKNNEKPLVNDNVSVESLFEDIKEERGNSNMDIDRIMREAKDINTPAEPKDISSLMQNNTIDNNSVNSASVNSNPINSAPTPLEPTFDSSPEAPQSKFINFGVQNMEPVSSQPISPTPLNNNDVTFDSIFNQSINNLSSEGSSSSENPSPTFDSPINSVDSSNNNGNLNFDFNNFNAQNSTTIPINNDINNRNNVNSAEPSSFNDTSFTFNEPENSELTISDSAKQNISAAVASAFSDSKVTFAPSDNGLNSNEVQHNSSLESPTLQMNIPGISPIIEPSLDSEPILSAHDNTPSDNGSKVNNFAQVVSLLRNCASEIEKLGYHVDLDELDLNSQYKMTFTIDK